MMDNKILIARLKRQYHSAEVGKCWVVDLIDTYTLSAYVCDLDWVRYYFDF